MPTKRDWILLLCLTGLSVVSSGTTILGAKQILPSPMAEITGLSVQTMLYLMLAGLMLTNFPVRKWFAVVVFSVISVYTSFFTYYDELAGKAESGSELEIALQAHAILTAETYQPHRQACDTLRGQADALYEAAEREANGGAVSGRKGYGPVARKYGAEAAAMQLEAKASCAVADQLKPLFEINVEGLTPEALFRSDLAAWQQAPAPKSDAPQRGRYVDLDSQIAFMTPITRVGEGKPPAILALALALLVDGTGLLLGTAVVVPIRRRRRKA